VQYVLVRVGSDSLIIPGSWVRAPPAPPAVYRSFTAEFNPDRPGVAIHVPKSLKTAVGLSEPNFLIPGADLDGARGRSLGGSRPLGEKTPSSTPRIGQTRAQGRPALVRGFGWRDHRGARRSGAFATDTRSRWQLPALHGRTPCGWRESVLRHTCGGGMVPGCSTRPQ
jgi:hypothetical protein